VGGFSQLRQGLDYEYQRAVRYEHPLGCLLFSIDQYELVREQRGPKSAGQIIGAVVAVLKKTLRSVDRIYRVDQGQFIILLPETSAAGSRVAAERIRAALRNPTRKGTRPLTISAALVAFPDPRIKTGRDVLRVVSELHKHHCTAQGDCLVGPHALAPSDHADETKLQAPKQ
jgi:diguanylate cyclase (GGDEF)-like protein